MKEIGHFKFINVNYERTMVLTYMCDKNVYINHELRRNQTLYTYYNSISNFQINLRIKIYNTIRFKIDRQLNLSTKIDFNIMSIHTYYTVYGN